MGKNTFQIRFPVQIATSIEVIGDSVTITVEGAKGGNETMKRDIVLVATGRQPLMNGLAFESMGIQTDRSGRI